MCVCMCISAALSWMAQVVVLTVATQANQTILEIQDSSIRHGCRWPWSRQTLCILFGFFRVREGSLCTIVCDQEPCRVKQAIPDIGVAIQQRPGSVEHSSPFSSGGRLVGKYLDPLVFEGKLLCHTSFLQDVLKQMKIVKLQAEGSRRLLGVRGSPEGLVRPINKWLLVQS